MLTYAGGAIVVLCVFGGFAGMGGNLATLFQPFEAIIIVGAAVGSFLLANPIGVVRRTREEVRAIVERRRYDREAYLELLGLLFVIFKTARIRGWLPLERHIEHPDISPLFARYKTFAANPHAVTFLCDYLRLVSLGSTNPYELAALMDEEIDTIHAERLQVADALQNAADAMPALGIVAAVLGIIHTMAAIASPPDALGRLIGGALVGTFLGVWLSYGFVGPIAAAVRHRAQSEIKYYACMKAGLLAYLQGSAAQVAIEFARKVLMAEDRPTFIEVEEQTLATPLSPLAA